MLKVLSISLISGFLSLFNLRASAEEKSLYDISARSLDGEVVPFSSFAGKVLLIVNTASKCGLAFQMNGLQELYETYRDKGFEVLGFPSNDFFQEPKEGRELEEACQIVDFTMFEKIHVNGQNRHPVYRFLIKNSKSSWMPIRWNFEKFLVDRNGNVVDRFAPTTKPMSAKIRRAITKVLN